MTLRLCHAVTRARRLIVAVSLAGMFLLGGQASAAGAAMLSTNSSFEWPSGTSGLINVHEPLYFYQFATSTSWSQTATFANATSEIATSKVSVAGEEVESNGTLRALLVWRVTGSGTESARIVEGVVCESHTTYSQCYTTVKVPSGSPAITTVRLYRSFEAASGNYWWVAALVTGSTQKDVGFILIPGGEETAVKPTAKISNSTTYTGAPKTTCAEVPQSTVAWLSPWEGEETGEKYAQYKESSIESGTCASTFTELNLGGVTGVKVKAPTE